MGALCRGAIPQPGFNLQGMPLPISSPVTRCPACHYDLADLPAEAPCPECGLASPGRVNAFRYRLADRRRSLRTFVWLMVPAWLFMVINAAGYITAFWILGVPRKTVISADQYRILDALAVVGWACVPTLAASALGLMTLPFLLVPAVRRFSEDDNPRRTGVLVLTAVPAIVLTLLLLFEPAPSVIFSWVPQ